MSTYYSYSAFGLTIHSCFPIPELTRSEQQSPDVRISYGKTPDHLDEIKGKGVLFQANENEFLFRLNTVGAYYVKNGKDIIVERLNESTDDELRLFLLGSTMGALIHQRGMLPVHGSTVVRDNLAFIISGIGGAGKSSLAAALLKRGYWLLADDISVVNKTGDGVLVYPGIPHLKLWLDVLNALNEDMAELKRVRPQLEKYKARADEKFLDQPVRPVALLVLSAKNSEGYSVEKITGAEKFSVVKNQTYRYNFLEGMSKWDQHFRISSELAGSVKIYLVKRPSSPVMLEELADFVETIIKTE